MTTTYALVEVEPDLWCISADENTPHSRILMAFQQALDYLIVFISIELHYVRS